MHNPITKLAEHVEWKTVWHVVLIYILPHQFIGLERKLMKYKNVLGKYLRRFIHDIIYI